MVVENPTGQTAVPSLQERKQQLVRDAIWQAATDLFSEKGYEETTVEDIAEKSGVSRRSFFRYFSSKSDLMAHGTVTFGLLVAQVVESLPQDWPVSRAFRETVLRVAQQSTADPRMRKVMEIAARYPAARAAQLVKMVDVHERIAEAFARRRTGVRNKAGDKHLTPGILAGLTVSVLSVIFRVWFEQGRKDISMAADQVLAGLGDLVCQTQR